ncbi:hypothetical protein EKKBBHHG_00169 [Klebsiella phage vB_KaS-Veronica]|uniref:Uncharacterized protein n=1 Tax=Klebsiella phage vB_KaS-Veronica TaxID=2762824 RepID=A0A7R8MN50_9CAUD|nr:hypothetical protein EKKBBHHG_00169 [Klebsiella phage vB_KaS-Veronica]
MKLAIVGFGLAMLSGAALAEVSAPAIVTPEKVRPMECRVSVAFAKEGTVTAVLRNKDFDSVTVDSGTWGFMVEPEPGKDGIQMIVNRSTFNANVVIFDENRDEVGRGRGVCF